MSVTIIVVDPIQNASEELVGKRTGLSSKLPRPEFIEIDSKRIVDQLNEITESLSKITVESSGDFGVQEVELLFNITVKGKLALLGSGVESGGQAGIRLKIARRIA